MKKTFIFLVLLTFCATGAFATDLNARLASTSLSAGVEGQYFCNNTAADDGTAFVIATANKQGTKVYSTANFVSDIYFKAFAGDKYESSDLPSSWDTFDSSAYSTDWDYKD